MPKLAPAERFVLVQRRNDGAEPEEDIARFADKDSAYAELVRQIEDCPDLYGGMSPVRRLVVLERAYQPHHAKLPIRVPGLAYALSIAPEAIEREAP